MRGGILLLATLLLTTVLAGCTGDDPGPTPSPTASASGSPSATAAPTAGGTSNQAPVPSLAVDVTNGTAPLNITLTVDGFDPDAQGFNWTLIQEGNGTVLGRGDELDLPATYPAMLAAGNFTFTLTMDDGTDTAAVSVNVTVHAPVVAAVAEPITHTGQILQPSVFGIEEGVCLEDGFSSFFNFLPGYSMFWHAFPVSSDTWGWDYHFDQGTDVVADFWNRDAAGLLGSGASGTVPPGSTWVFVCGTSAFAANTPFILVLSPP